MNERSSGNRRPFFYAKSKSYHTSMQFGLESSSFVSNTKAMKNYLVKAGKELLLKFNSNEELIDKYLNAIIRAYASTQRHYHNLEHIYNMLQLIDEVELEEGEKEVVQLATFFHDVVYVPGRKDNEEISADYATKVLTILNIIPALQEKVKSLILQTKNHHSNEPLDRLIQVFLDIDLAVLGSGEKLYEAYSNGIRKEFHAMDKSKYLKGRKLFLESMLSSDFIYHTPEFRNQLETNARINLENELAEINKTLIQKEEKRAIYAFSGDPITYGHIDVIKRAAMLFDHLIVAIGNNPTKKYLFTIEERTQLAIEALKGLKKVEVVAFKGMLTDFAFERDVKTIVRGLRNTEDFNFEMMFHQVNEGQRLNIDTFFIPTKRELSHVSSGVVKAIQKEQGAIEGYVPLNVKQQVELKVTNQLLIGVTGVIGAGKSTFCQRMIKESAHEVHHIDMDKIGKEILFALNAPIYHKIRREINLLMESENETKIDAGELQQTIFSDLNLLQKFNAILKQPFEVQLRKRLYGLKGIVLIESALFAEVGISSFVNNYMVLLSCNEKEQKERLLERGYSVEKIKFRKSAQYTTEKKREVLLKEINKAGFGELMECTDDKMIRLTIQKIDNWYPKTAGNQMRKMVV